MAWKTLGLKGTIPAGVLVRPRGRPCQLLDPLLGCASDRRGSAEGFSSSPGFTPTPCRPWGGKANVLAGRIWSLVCESLARQTACGERWHGFSACLPCDPLDSRAESLRRTRQLPTVLFVKNMMNRAGGLRVPPVRAMRAVPNNGVAHWRWCLWSGSRGLSYR